MLTKRELPYLRGPLIVLISLLVLGGILIWYLEDMLAHVNQDVMASRQARTNAQQSLDKVQEEEAEIKKYLLRYKNWDRLGAFSEFERAWVADQLDATFKLIPNAAILYRIGGRQPFVNSDTEAAMGYAVYQYIISLTGRTAHEESFVQLAKSIEQNLSGPLSWERCQLNRTSGGERAGLPYLNIECTLSWTMIDKITELAPTIPPMSNQ